MEKIPYNDKMDLDMQVSALREVRDHLIDACNDVTEASDGQAHFNDEDGAKLAGDVLYLMLRRFRPDLFVDWHAAVDRIASALDQMIPYSELCTRTRTGMSRMRLRWSQGKSLEDRPPIVTWRDFEAVGGLAVFCQVRNIGDKSLVEIYELAKSCDVRLKLDASLDRSALFPFPTRPDFHARVVWQVSDVQTLFDVTDREALEFLWDNSNNIQDAMVERGWSAIEDLGQMANLTSRKPE